MEIDPFAINAALGKTAVIKNLYTGNCKGCGECCSRILPLSEHDIKRLRDYVRKHNIKQMPEYGAGGAIDMTCPYLSEDSECLVFHARPDICRAYRCDKQVSGDFSPLRRFMRHHPYKESDMREVIE